MNDQTPASSVKESVGCLVSLAAILLAVWLLSNLTLLDTWLKGFFQ